MKGSLRAFVSHNSEETWQSHVIVYLMREKTLVELIMLNGLKILLYVLIALKKSYRIESALLVAIITRDRLKQRNNFSNKVGVSFFLKEGIPFWYFTAVFR